MSEEKIIEIIEYDDAIEIYVWCPTVLEECVVTLYEREGSNIVGLASIVFDESFSVGNAGMVEGKKGMFVAMPSYKADSRYRDVCFPITKKFREKVNRAVLVTYQQAKEQKIQEEYERAAQQMQTNESGFMLYDRTAAVSLGNINKRSDTGWNIHPVKKAL